MHASASAHGVWLRRPAAGVVGTPSAAAPRLGGLACGATVPRCLPQRSRPRTRTLQLLLPQQQRPGMAAAGAVALGRRGATNVQFCAGTTLRSDRGARSNSAGGRGALALLLPSARSPPAVNTCGPTARRGAQQQQQQQQQQQRRLHCRVPGPRPHASSAAEGASSGRGGAAGGEAPWAGSDLDVWILAGQSNMVGDNIEDGTPMPAAAMPLPGRLLSYGPAGRWLDAQPNVHLGTHHFPHQDSVGPDMAFGRTLIELGVGQRVGVVPAARGGTNLYSEWQPYGKLYDFLLQRTHDALAASPPGGGSCHLRGMVWVQGEADAYESAGRTAAESYGANFVRLLEALRKDLAPFHPCLPVVLGVMPVRQRSNFPYIEVVRQQQLALDMPYMSKVDLAGYEMFEQYGGFRVHLTKDGATALGRAMAHVVYAQEVQRGAAAGSAA